MQSRLTLGITLFVIRNPAVPGITGGADERPHPPSAPDLNKLSADMQKLIEELMTARGMRGFITLALLADKKSG